jgi:hypothetical protein
LGPRTRSTMAPRGIQVFTKRIQSIAWWSLTERSVR